MTAGVSGQPCAYRHQRIRGGSIRDRIDCLDGDRAAPSAYSGFVERPGGTVSRTVICWTHVLWLLQSSVAVQVRLMTLMVAPDKTGGCGGRGPSGGCSCGGGRMVSLLRLPIEIVLLPTVMGSGGFRTF